MGAFGNRTLSDLSGFFSDDSTIISVKNNPLRLRLPNAPNIIVYTVVRLLQRFSFPDAQGSALNATPVIEAYAPNSTTYTTSLVYSIVVDGATGRSRRHHSTASTQSVGV